VIHHERDVREE